MTDVDLVVVGAGTAGLPAAVAAAELGLRTLVVEASDRLGGTLWRSWAQMSAAGTSLQRARGIQDDPELHFDDVMRISKGTADPVLVRSAVQHAPHVIEWLLRLGFDVDPACPAVLHFHEPYSLPRTYWGRSGGRSVLEVLLPAAEEAVAGSGVTVRTGTSLVSLLAGHDRVRRRPAPRGGRHRERGDRRRGPADDRRLRRRPRALPEPDQGRAAGRSRRPDVARAGDRRSPRDRRAGARRGPVPAHLRRGPAGRERLADSGSGRLPGTDAAGPASRGRSTSTPRDGGSSPRTPRAWTCGRTRCSSSRA